MIETIETLISQGVFETFVLVTILTLFIIIEMLSGINLSLVIKIRRVLIVALIPVGLFFILLAITRIMFLL